jgi:hypothetical protein
MEILIFTLLMTQLLTRTIFPSNPLLALKKLKDGITVKKQTTNAYTPRQS